MQKINFLELNFKSKIKLQNDSTAYLSSEAGIKEGNRINIYYEKFIEPYQFKSCPTLPDLNPWEFTLFKTKKNPLDFYSVYGKVNRGFFISDKTKNILKEYDLPLHIIFENLIYFDGIDQKDDLNWISFSQFLMK